VTLTWGTSGPQAITVTATCSEGTSSDTQAITIYRRGGVYLPLILR